MLPSVLSAPFLLSRRCNAKNIVVFASGGGGAGMPSERVLHRVVPHETRLPMISGSWGISCGGVCGGYGGPPSLTPLRPRCWSAESRNSCIVIDGAVGEEGGHTLPRPSPSVACPRDHDASMVPGWGASGQCHVCPRLLLLRDLPLSVALCRAGARSPVHGQCGSSTKTDPDPRHEEGGGGGGGWSGVGPGHPVAPHAPPPGPLPGTSGPQAIALHRRTQDRFEGDAPPLLLCSRTFVPPSPPPPLNLRHCPGQVLPPTPQRRLGVDRRGIVAVQPFSHSALKSPVVPDGHVPAAADLVLPQVVCEQQLSQADGPFSGRRSLWGRASVSARHTTGPPPGHGLVFILSGKSPDSIRRRGPSTLYIAEHVQVIGIDALTPTPTTSKP